MKKFPVILFLVAMTTMCFGQISGTLHDFSSDAWTANMVTNHACGPCHTPHNSLASTDAPLWSHDPTANSGSFSVYTSTGTLDATVGQPSGVSLKCLGCHDGSVNLNSHIGGGAAIATTMGDVNAAADVGTALGNDHPISFAWDATLIAADLGLHDPTSTVSGLGGNINVDMLFGASNTQMECASCHDPHGAGNAKLLRIDNSNSALCLTCHNK